MGKFDDKVDKASKEAADLIYKEKIGREYSEQDCHRAFRYGFDDGVKWALALNKLPKRAQEGLKKLGEKIGDSEWDEVFKEYSEYYSDVFGLQVWLKEHYFPPKSKNK